MEHQYLALTTRSVIKVILLAACIVSSAQQNATNSNITTGDDGADTTTPKNSTNPSTSTTPKTPATTLTTKLPTTTIKPTTTPKPLGNLRPVDQPCLKLYFNCTETNAEFLKANFCQAFREKVACFNDTSKVCSQDEVNRIEYVDCGPNVLGINGTVGTSCQGRITECLSLSDKPANIKITTDFKTFFCAKQTKSCLIEKYGTAVCTEPEYKEALRIAKCTAAHTVSSALFMTLAILTQRIIYRY